VLAEEALAPLASPDFRITCLRFATACGMTHRLRLDLVLNDFAASALVHKRINILSDGTPWRPLIHVRDMARAMTWAVDRPVADGGAFLVVNAGSERWTYQIRQLAEAVAKELPGISIAINPNAAPDKRSYKVDFSLFQRLAPNHQPQETLPTAVSELMEGLTQMDFNDPNFRQSHLIRLVTLEKLRKSGLLTENLTWVDH
jgi:nucleoside-diphosphate-sugar epimerase